MRVDVVLPAYNEAENLPGQIAEIHKVFSKILEDYSIIVVDDGSTDNSSRLLARLAMRDRRLSVLRFEKNQGYGAALRAGFREARREWVFFTDSDRQFRLEEFEILKNNAPGADMVVGYRKKRKDSLYRCILALIFNLSTRFFLGINIRDTNCAFKLIRRSLLDDMKLTARGALINAELFVLARRKGARIIQIGVSHRPRLNGMATGSRLSVILVAIREFIKLFLKYRLNPGELL